MSVVISDFQVLFGLSCERECKVLLKGSVGLWGFLGGGFDASSGERSLNLFSAGICDVGKNLQQFWFLLLCRG